MFGCQIKHISHEKNLHGRGIIMLGPMGAFSGY